MKIKFFDINGVFWKTLAFFSKHIFFSIFISLLISGIIVFYFFYSFQFLAGKRISETGPSIKLRDDAYNSVFKSWNNEKLRLEQAKTKEYDNIFYIPPSPSASATSDEGVH